MAVVEISVPPLGTIIEGEIDALFARLRQMHEAPFAQGASRVSTLNKIADRRDAGEHIMAGKMAAVEDQLR